MGSDESALIRLWREKRGEVEPEDLSGNLIVQLGTVTEDLNRRWYELNSREVIKHVQRRAQHQVLRWMAATLDGVVESTGAVFEAKFMLPWSFSEEAAAEKHMAQLQHNMWVIQSRSAVLSIITGGGKWVEMTIPADPLYQHLLLTAEKKFWRCVESGEAPHLFGVETPQPRIEAVRIVDMTSSNSWAEFAGVFCQTRGAFLNHEAAKVELKNMFVKPCKTTGWWSAITTLLQRIAVLSPAPSSFKQTARPRMSPLAPSLVPIFRKHGTPQPSSSPAHPPI